MEENAAHSESESKDKDEISVLFGRNVKKYRKQAGLTQEQLSERLGVSQKHLSIIETGTQFASASLIGRISSELNVSPGDLFGGSSDTVIEEIKKFRAMIMTMLVNELNRHGSILSTDIENLRNQLNVAPRL
ncbi:MAG: helix-turn-helix transcriptional regulator [Treponema sp.]|uniref:helix-turn-helix domain-containing protein n=1 Tax=Treponema sp. TaxID=166 RepID=UPI0025D0F550|nr:helix-turn-helix transcriptional regulator [Treponema sp.]MBQ9621765.1 helix-turn-helix transcriptional regulator [Treponema sp.]MBR0497444.1 helix-turn-helix transcriptional regulator [Treponema sp.]